MAFLKFEPKSLRWLLAETLVVVLGIMLAFQVENWQEYRLERTKEKSALINLYNDLESDLSNIERILARTEFRKLALKELLESLQQDSFHNAQAFAETFTNAMLGTVWQPRSNTYIGLKDTAQLGIIQDETLRNDIIRYYEVSQVYITYRADLLEERRERVTDSFRVDIYRSALDLPIAGSIIVEVPTNSGYFNYSVQLPLSEIPRNRFSYADSGELYNHLDLFKSRTEDSVNLLKELHAALKPN